MSDREKTLADLEAAQKEFTAVLKAIAEEQEEFWNSLSRDDQLKCFCAVVRRILQGEKEGRSYRGILYNIFDFGVESYVQAQDAGFIEIHNAIDFDDKK